MDAANPNLALFLREMPTATEWQGKKTTKPFKKGGGFSGTSLDAMYVVARLTSAFGPCGIGWGYEVKSERCELLPSTEEGKVRGMHFATVRFWYKHDGQTGSFDEIGGTPIQGYGDDDAGKKSVTDAVTKAASRIGIGADIHLGKFDDSKYVSDREKETQAETLKGKAAAIKKLAADTATLTDEIKACADNREYLRLRGEALTFRQRLLDAGLGEELDELGNALTDAKARLAPPAAAAE